MKVQIKSKPKFFPNLIIYLSKIIKIQLKNMCKITHNNQPVANQMPVGIAWPFAQWGMDILGPFPIIISKEKSSKAGYKISSTLLFNL